MNWWAAEIDDRNGMWQPVLQIDDLALGVGCEIWFDTEAECRRFIAEHIIGSGLEDV